MSFLQTLMLLLILSANGIIVPNSVWYCLIAWVVILLIKSIKEEIIEKNKKTEKIKKALDKDNEI